MLVPVTSAASTSPAKKPLLMRTVAEARFALSLSLTVSAGASVVPAAFSVNDAVVATLASTGGSLKVARRRDSMEMGMAWLLSYPTDGRGSRRRRVRSPASAVAQVGRLDAGDAVDGERRPTAPC